IEPRGQRIMPRGSEKMHGSILVSHTSETKPKKRKKSFPSRVRDALLPFIDKYEWGEKVTFQDAKTGQQVKKPVFVNTQEQWRLLARWKAGERDVNYPDGWRFRHWHIKQIRVKDIREMLDGQRTLYFTGSRSGQSACMIDEDAHEPEWQTDLPDLHADVLE